MAGRKAGDQGYEHQNVFHLPLILHLRVSNYRLPYCFVRFGAQAILQTNYSAKTQKRLGLITFL